MENFYNSFYTIFEEFLGGAPSWVFEFVVPTFILLLFIFMIYFILKLFTTFTTSLFKASESNEKPRRKKGKFY